MFPTGIGDIHLGLVVLGGVVPEAISGFFVDSKTISV
jgi:hypothetical protein